MPRKLHRQTGETDQVLSEKLALVARTMNKCSQEQYKDGLKNHQHQKQSLQGNTLKHKPDHLGDEATIKTYGQIWKPAHKKRSPKNSNAHDTNRTLSN